MRAVHVETPGAADGMVVKTDEIKPVPKPNELLIKVAATAINRADTLQRKGLYPPPPGAPTTLGLECAGVVAAVGSECTGRFDVGDRVMALLGGGGYAEYCVVDETHTMAVPAGFSLRDAAAIPEAWLTAFQILHFVGKLDKDDVVLIHAGGSGVGTAATQLAALHGATVLVTAGSAAKRESALALGAKAAFERGDNWAAEVLKATDGKGATLVLDCIGSQYWKQNTEALALDGKWVLYGLMGGAAIDGPILGAVLRKRICLTGTTLRSRSSQYKAQLVDAFATTAVPQFGSVDSAPPRLRVVVDRVFEMDAVVAAHKHMEANSNTGKIVLQIADDPD